MPTFSFYTVNKKYFCLTFQTYLADDTGRFDGVMSELDSVIQDQAKSEIQTDYAKADVYFQTLNVVYISQSPMMAVRFFFKLVSCLYLAIRVAIYHQPIINKVLIIRNYQIYYS